MQNRIHGIISDVVFEARSLEGMPDAEAHMEQIRQIAGDQIEGMTPTVVVPAMLSFQLRRQLDDAAGAIDRHRRGDAGRASAISARICNIRPTARRRLSCSSSARAASTRRDHQGGEEIAASGTQMRAPAGNAAARSARPMQEVPAGDVPSRTTRLPQGRRRRPIPSPSTASEAGGHLRSGQGAAYRRGPGHRHGQLSHAQGRRPLSACCRATTSS